MQDWYKNMSFYQIWIRSFADGNDDGIGDLLGVYDKLTYIKSLGVDGIWFSPLYPSPNADFGYDISDYKNIHPDYGTLSDFKRVLNRAHELGLKVIMDLVINHTSDEHPWFIESKKGGDDNPYKDYYIWRDGKGDKLPNNWESFFEGKAWEWCEERGQYYLHIFAKKQPDLNMDNPAVREEIKSIMRFWLDMGVDGFREDVINFISKVPGLPDGNPMLPVINGMPYFKDGPHIHEYLAEFRKVCEEYDCFQLGEGPMSDLKSVLLYTSGEHKSLDMMFNFDHMQADCFMTEYIQRPFSLRKLKRAFSKWQYGLYGKSWNALYIENHDHPRVVSRYGSEEFHRESATALAASYLFQQGTPFIYQGQEIGMTNIRLSSIDLYMDVSSKTNYSLYHLNDPEELRLARIHASSRDSARTPMQWDSSENAGFSRHKPWFYVNDNYTRINVASQEKDKNSILNFYRTCLNYRKRSRICRYGKYREFFADDPKIYTYEREYKGKSLLIICSFSDKEEVVRLPKKYRGRLGHVAICNYPDPEWGLLKPYEARVYETISNSERKNHEKN
ncbi:MAG: alpha-glucosidase [Lachnospiraceae bacterium]|nr:alpha-glucosidase [Lachnospiraceae bacterium]